jgi:hypothetical protein
VKVSDHPGRRSQKKSVRKKKGHLPIFQAKIVARLRRQIDDRWPNLGRRLAFSMKVSREKLDDIYSSVAQFVTEHKEAFEDRLAENKAQAWAATRNGQCPTKRSCLPSSAPGPRCSKRRNCHND